MILNKDVIDTKRTACILERKTLKDTGMKLTGIIGEVGGQPLFSDKKTSLEPNLPTKNISLERYQKYNVD